MKIFLTCKNVRFLRVKPSFLSLLVRLGCNSFEPFYLEGEGMDLHLQEKLWSFKEEDIYLSIPLASVTYRDQRHVLGCFISFPNFFFSTLLFRIFSFLDSLTYSPLKCSFSECRQGAC
jgi:hypothetical protein